MKKITFHLGAEKQIKVSTAGHNDSLFYEGYRQAMAGVIEIVRASESYTRPRANTAQEGGALRSSCYDQAGNCKGNTLFNDWDYYNYPNNLLVFTGGRGTGKSSAMLTFVSSLGNKSSQLFTRKFIESMVRCELPGMVAEEEGAVSAVYDLLRETTFLPLSPIDPTTLEEDGQILINILARMFQKAQEVWEEKSQTQESSRNLNQRDLLAQQFTTCYESVVALRNQDVRREEFDGLDLLASLGDSSGLKKQLAQLVEQLLRFCCSKDGENAYLVLQIDDTDMNVRHAYTILEDLRKYLVIPRLIIVMAADLNHLTQVVKSSFLRSYGKEMPGMDKYVRDITAQYVSKLIPQSRRICLPEVGVYLKEHPETEIRYFAGAAQIIPDESENFKDSQEQIFRMIYRKTGMIFLSQENHLHYIIPDNMRLLHYFLSMLVQMPNAANPDAKTPEFFLPEGANEAERETHLTRLQNRLQNVQRFRDYFFSIWANNTLTEKHAEFLRGLSNANLSDKTRMVCGEMGLDGSSTYADMIRALRDKEREEVEEEGKKFIFAIHIYFTLLAHSIVLEELISYYNRPVSKQNGCRFMRLYPIFGSRIFSYLVEEDFYGLEDIYDDDVNQEETEDIWKKRIDKVDEKIEVRADIPIMINHQKPFRIRWRIPAQMGEVTISDFMQTAEQNPKFLYSMLCPYDQSENNREIWADFSTPLINALYLDGSQYVTPLSNKAIANSVAVNSILNEEIWQDMQSSALMAVLNWDLQKKLGDFLFRKVEVPQNYKEGIPGAAPQIESEDLLECLQGFYYALDNEAARSDTGRFPVACTEYTGFFSWLYGLLKSPYSMDVLMDPWIQMTRAFYNCRPFFTSEKKENPNGTNSEGDGDDILQMKIEEEPDHEAGEGEGSDPK